MAQNLFTVWLGLNEYLEGFVVKKTGDKEAAKDIVQDVFLKAQSSIGTLKNDKKVTPWIFQIARNAIADHYRKQAKALSPVFREIEDPEEVHPDKETVRLARCMLPMIDMLPERYREAILLSEIEGLSQKELAVRLGISYSGAKSRVQRGREKLKALFLECCSIKTDRYGNVIEYHKKACSSDCN